LKWYSLRGVYLRIQSEEVSFTKIRPLKITRWRDASKSQRHGAKQRAQDRIAARPSDTFGFNEMR
jgi:hypothetical protein